jgi:iron-sulfur cluster assembly accessory protein
MISPIQIQTVLLTPAAAEVVRSLREQQKLDNSYALRIYITGQTCSGFHYGMALDNKPRGTDMTFESEGLKVLVDDTSIKYIAGASVDFVDDERGKGFLVNNPNAVPSCSCDSGNCDGNENYNK